MSNNGSSHSILRGLTSIDIIRKFDSNLISMPDLITGFFVFIEVLIALRSSKANSGRVIFKIFRLALPDEWARNSEMGPLN